MPLREITLWKRKKSEAEERIHRLEAVRKKTTLWQEKVSRQRKELLWHRQPYQEFAEELQPRIVNITEENARQLDQAKQELNLINQNIQNLQEKQIKVFPLFLVLGIVLGLGLLFLQPNLTGLVVTSLTGEEVTAEIHGLEHFRADEEPAFTITVKERGAGLTTQSGVNLSASRDLQATLIYPGGEEKLLEQEIIRTAEGFAVKLNKGREFRAGLYRLLTNVTTASGSLLQEQNFTWGVLAINTHQSIYLENENAFLGMAVLNDEGGIVCNAEVTLTITSPLNDTTTFSTENGTIAISPECEVYGVTNRPDYYTNFTVSGSGEYLINLTAVTQNGRRTILDRFLVQPAVDFEVARQAPTRIYPLVPYTVNLTVKANQDYQGIIREFVPASFAITPQEDLNIITANDAQILSWNIDLTKGQTTSLHYEFDAPDASPEFYLLGPLEIGAWTEARQWQIASDQGVQTARVSADMDMVAINETHYALLMYNITGARLDIVMVNTTGTLKGQINVATGASNLTRLGFTMLNDSAFFVGWANTSAAVKAQYQDISAMDATLFEVASEGPNPREALRLARRNLILQIASIIIFLISIIAIIGYEHWKHREKPSGPSS